MNLFLLIPLGAGRGRGGEKGGRRGGRGGERGGGEVLFFLRKGRMER